MRKSLLSLSLLAALAATAAAPAGDNLQRAPRRSPSQRINIFPATQRHFAPPSRPDRMGLPEHDGAWWESFEGYEKIDGDSYAWMPEGWQRQGNDGLQPYQTWFVTNNVGYTVPADGDFFAICNMCMDKQQDEWLITPMMKVNPGDELSYYVFYDPIYFFDNNLINWTAKEWYQQVQTCNLRLYARPEGKENWQLLRDFAADFDGWSVQQIEDFTDATNMDMWREKQWVSQYEGQNVQFAFRYTGINGDAVYIDAVRLGAPVIDNVSYQPPLSILYWGFECRDGLYAQPTQVGLAPAGADLRWENTSVIDSDQEPDYQWEYRLRKGGDQLTAVGSDLDMSYSMPLDMPEGLKHNMVGGAPTLRASLPNGSEGSYRAPFEDIQAGGEACTDDGTRLGLLPFSYLYDGIDVVTKTGADLSQPATPIFGHSSTTTAWWTDHYFQGEPETGDKAEVTAIANAMLAPESPLVVESLWLNAKGSGIADDAVFTASIIPCVEVDGGFEPSDTPLASATCTGAQMLVWEPGVRDYLTIPFEFQAPVVLDQTYPMYFIKVSGFNSDKVEYFVPMQSTRPFDNRMTLGWISIDLTLGGEPSGSTLSPMANLKGSQGDCYNAFAINLGGYYPWITPQELEVSMADGLVELPLPGYYDAADYTFTQADGSPLPQGLEITGQGRYDQGLLFVDWSGNGDLDCEVRIQAPGIDKKMHVYDTGTGTGIGQVNAAGQGSAATYDLLGRRVSGKPAPGVYVRNGRKVVIR